MKHGRPTFEDDRAQAEGDASTEPTLARLLEQFSREALHELRAIRTLLERTSESANGDQRLTTVDVSPLPRVEPRSLSRRAAARALGVSRNETMRLLIEAGLLTPTHSTGRHRFRGEDIDRLNREGFPGMAELRALAPRTKQRAPRPRRTPPTSGRTLKDWTYRVGILAAMVVNGFTHSAITAGTE